LSDIPAQSELASSNFVLVDYQNGVAIKSGGFVYQLNQEEIQNKYKENLPQNYYDPKIIDEAAWTQRAKYVSEDTFVGREPEHPSVNNWQISKGIHGFNISFSELSSDRLDISASPIGQAFRLDTLAYGRDGLIAEISLDGKTKETVYLGAPTSEQAASMHKLTENIIAPTGPDKIRAYVDLINDLSQNLQQSNTKALENLQTGQFVVVRDQGESVGVMYQVFGPNRDLVIVGGSDNELRHPPMLSHDELANKVITAVDFEKAVADKIRFSNDIVYAELNENKVGGKIAVTIGEKDLASDHVNGATYFAQTTKIDVDKAVTNECPSHEL
jgi:hypothetical protein